MLHDKGFNIAKNPKSNGYQRGLSSVVCKFFNKSSSGGTFKSEIRTNQKLAEE